MNNPYKPVAMTVPINSVRSLSPGTMQNIRRMFGNVHLPTGTAANSGTHSTLFEVHENKSHGNSPNGDIPVSVFERTNMLQGADSTSTPGRTPKPPVPVKPQFPDGSSDAVVHESNTPDTTITHVRPSTIKRISRPERKSEEMKGDNGVPNTSTTGESTPDTTSTDVRPSPMKRTSRSERKSKEIKEDNSVPNMSTTGESTPDTTSTDVRKSEEMKGDNSVPNTSTTGESTPDTTSTDVRKSEEMKGDNSVPNTSTNMFHGADSTSTPGRTPKPPVPVKAQFPDGSSDAVVHESNSPDTTITHVRPSTIKRISRPERKSEEMKGDNSVPNTSTTGEPTPDTTITDVRPSPMNGTSRPERKSEEIKGDNSVPNTLTTGESTPDTTSTDVRKSEEMKGDNSVPNTSTTGESTPDTTSTDVRKSEEMKGDNSVPNTSTNMFHGADSTSTPGRTPKPPVPVKAQFPDGSSDAVVHESNSPDTTITHVRPSTIKRISRPERKSEEMKGDNSVPNTSTTGEPTPDTTITDVRPSPMNGTSRPERKSEEIKGDNSVPNTLTTGESTPDTTSTDVRKSEEMKGDNSVPNTSTTGESTPDTTITDVRPSPMKRTSRPERKSEEIKEDNSVPNTSTTGESTPDTTSTDVRKSEEMKGDNSVPNTSTNMFQGADSTSTPGRTPKPPVPVKAQFPDGSSDAVVHESNTPDTTITHVRPSTIKRISRPERKSEEMKGDNSVPNTSTTGESTPDTTNTDVRPSPMKRTSRSERKSKEIKEDNSVPNTSTTGESTPDTTSTDVRKSEEMKGDNSVPNTSTNMFQGADSTSTPGRTPKPPVPVKAQFPDGSSDAVVHESNTPDTTITHVRPSTIKRISRPERKSEEMKGDNSVPNTSTTGESTPDTTNTDVRPSPMKRTSRSERKSKEIKEDNSVPNTSTTGESTPDTTSTDVRKSEEMKGDNSVPNTSTNMFQGANSTSTPGRTPKPPVPVKPQFPDGSSDAVVHESNTPDTTITHVRPSTIKRISLPESKSEEMKGDNGVPNTSTTGESTPDTTSTDVRPSPMKRTSRSERKSKEIKEDNSVPNTSTTGESTPDTTSTDVRKSKEMKGDNSVPNTSTTGESTPDTTSTDVRPSPMKGTSRSERKSKEIKGDNSVPNTSPTGESTPDTTSTDVRPSPLNRRSRSERKSKETKGDNSVPNTSTTGEFSKLPKQMQPLHPPTRQGSLSEQRRESLNENQESGSGKPARSTKPPAKPPRTGVHNIKVQLEKERQANEELVDSYTDCDSITCPKVLKEKTSASTDEQNDNCSSQGRGPVRSPPPLRKPSPFYIATDTISYRSSEESDSDTEPKIDNPFYETVAPVDLDPIQHWDLPRQTHPEPIRRSRSYECLFQSMDKAVDNDDNVVYMHPDVLGLRKVSGYDIYVDSAGYAVPGRVVKRTVSMEETEGSEVKQKVNQAFALLQGPWRQQRLGSDVTADLEDEEDKGETSSTGSKSQVDEKETRKLVEYTRSVRFKTSVSIRATQKYTEEICMQLFEYAMIVSLQLNQQSGEYEPYVKFKFPEIKQSNVSVPLFCFPDAANFKPSSRIKSQSYYFVLTNFDGARVYGYCRRLLPRKSPNKLPEVICVISPVDAFLMYTTLLEEIAQKRLLSLELAQDMIVAAFGRPLPAPGKSSIIRTLDMDGEMETIYLNRETESRMSNTNGECLLSSLGVNKLLKVFSSILLERSVLFSGKHLGVLSSTIHALTSLLYPFSWQHTFVPVLPAAMIDVVCSPTPYIIGITSSLLQHALSLPLDENVLVIDLDKKSLVRSQGDEGTLLPREIKKALKTALNMCRIDADVKSSPNLMISEAFIRFFVLVIGHYDQCILAQPGSQKTFEREKFVGAASSSSLRQLLEWFVETQMFNVFISNQLETNELGNTIRNFQGRIHEYVYGVRGGIGL